MAFGKQFGQILQDLECVIIPHVLMQLIIYIHIDYQINLTFVWLIPGAARIMFYVRRLDVTLACLYNIDLELTFMRQ